MSINNLSEFFFLSFEYSIICNVLVTYEFFFKWKKTKEKKVTQSINKQRNENQQIVRTSEIVGENSKQVQIKLNESETNARETKIDSKLFWVEFWFWEHLFNVIVCICVQNHMVCERISLQKRNRTKIKQKSEQKFGYVLIWKNRQQQNSVFICIGVKP